MMYSMIFKLILFFSLVSHAGIGWQAVATNKGKKYDITTSVDEKGFKSESKSSEIQVAIIFNTEKETMYNVIAGKKTYSESNKEDVKKSIQQLKKMQEKMAPVSAANNDMMKQILAKVPPEKRKQIEAQMKASQPVAKPKVKKEYKKVAGGEKCGKWTCDKYEIRDDRGARFAEAWFTSVDAIGLGSGEKKTLEKLVKFMEPYKEFENSSYDTTPEADVTRGFLVKRTAEGKTYEVTEVEMKSFSAGEFLPPSGFKKMAKGTLP